jgi:hypothetical protein
MDTTTQTICVDCGGEIIAGEPPHELEGSSRGSDLDRVPLPRGGVVV